VFFAMSGGSFCWLFERLQERFVTAIVLGSRFFRPVRASSFSLLRQRKRTKEKRSGGWLSKSLNIQGRFAVLPAVLGCTNGVKNNIPESRGRSRASQGFWE
jgi:hypothetical protein